MLTGTETRPKEIVAVPIERAGMGGSGKGEAGSGKWKRVKKVARSGATPYSQWVTNISDVENFAWFNSH
jgi:hypothetical protein